MRALERLIVLDPDLGEEVSLLIAQSGRTIRTDAGGPGGRTVGADYVRVLDPGGVELAYWTHEEWEAEPVEVMGAILALAGGG